MDINATLFGQMITFAIFVWFTVKFIWPPLMKAIRDRAKEIADGFAAADEAQRSKERAKFDYEEKLKDARAKYDVVIKQAEEDANRIVEDAKERARLESQLSMKRTEEELERMRLGATTQLRSEFSGLAVMGAEKILKVEIDAQQHQKLLDDVLKEIAHV